ncbi:hypothetical protein [Micromonospora pallida]|uniref:hypothetical protein n=1 Tax=Micromonospora pallida TaxID=145854 RepID=UPI000B8179B8
MLAQVPGFGHSGNREPASSPTISNQFVPWQPDERRALSTSMTEGNGRASGTRSGLPRTNLADAIHSDIPLRERPCSGITKSDQLTPQSPILGAAAEGRI